MQVTESHFCKRAWIVICKECGASSRLRLEYMSLLHDSEILGESFSCTAIYCWIDDSYEIEVTLTS